MKKINFGEALVCLMLAMVGLSLWMQHKESKAKLSHAPVQQSKSAAPDDDLLGPSREWKAAHKQTTATAPSASTITLKFLIEPGMPGFRITAGDKQDSFSKRVGPNQASESLSIPRTLAAHARITLKFSDGFWPGYLDADTFTFNLPSPAGKKEMEFQISTASSIRRPHFIVLLYGDGCPLPEILSQ